MTLKQIANAIKANCVDERAQLISWEEFDARQRKLWNMVTNGEQNIIGSPCAHRHGVVMRHLGFGN